MLEDLTVEHNDSENDKKQHIFPNSEQLHLGAFYWDCDDLNHFPLFRHMQNADKKSHGEILK